VDDYQKFIATSRYARWLDDEGRRETWDETVERYTDYFSQRQLITEVEADELYTDIVNLRVMPSMRALMTAGPALERCNVAGYNCAYLPVDSPRSFDEAMYILLCGTGVGFSVERDSVTKLPEIPEDIDAIPWVLTAKDSKEGWATILRELIYNLYGGYLPKWDLSQVRPAGARLKTFGGRASGPAPLDDLLNFVVNKFMGARGRKLNSLECHDIMCKIGEVVVVGGVRRSAMISLSNLQDDRLRGAKQGNWWQDTAYRALSNNSVCYTVKPDMGTFLKEWTALYESKSGERGIFNRQASEKQVLKNGRREGGHQWGTNPCSEIILRPYQFCNLSEVVVRADDTEETLRDKVETATILGTLQSTLTNFKYLRKVWTKNTEEERLLGVSLTGILDNPELIRRPGVLKRLKEHAVEVNRVWAERLGIPQSTAITCVKPSGTVSQLVDSASGIHPRWSEYYIRTVRGDNKDPITAFLTDMGVPSEPDVMKPDQTTVFSFPQMAPVDAVTREDLTAIEHLELWKFIQDEWCEHKPSITVNVREDEWFEVGAWVYENFDSISGVAFLPYSEHTYKQAPYQEVDFATYEAAAAKMPKNIPWSKLSEYETTDQTKSSQTFACTGDFCEVVDIT
jgi:ribonucleoside-triphosphate reductase